MRFSLPRPHVFEGRLRWSPGRAAAAFVLLLVFLPHMARAARAIPDDVAIQIYAKPANGHLTLAVRALFTAINDISFPLREGSSYLDLARVQGILPGAAKYWIASGIEIDENGSPLPRPNVIATRVSLPSDRSFLSYDAALAHLQGDSALPENTDIIPSQAWLDILFDYPIQSDRSAFSIHTTLDRLGVRVYVDLKFLAPEGVIRAFNWEGDPGTVRLDPTPLEVANQFLVWGFREITGATDALLFLFCLVLPFTSGQPSSAKSSSGQFFSALRAAIPPGCAFATTTSITLIASALGQAPDGLWFKPLIETLIAVLILYIAFENIAGKVTLWRRTLTAVAAGLIFGFSFASGLAAKAEYGGGHPAASAAAFDAGVELGLAAILALLTPVLNLLFRFATAKRMRDMEAVVLSALVAHTAWHWMTERWDRLSRFTLHWPAFDAAFLAAAMRWLTILVVLAGVLWFVSGLFEHKPGKASRGEA